MFSIMIQVGLSTVATLGGIVGDVVFPSASHSLFSRYISAKPSERLSFVLSLSLVTGMFILFADLIPKRIGMIAPEAVALRTANPMRFCLYVCAPLVWFFSGLANIISRIFKLPVVRKDDIIPDDIYAVVEAGTLTGVLRKREHELTENVFGLESRTVPSSMTLCENMIQFNLREDGQSLEDRAAEHLHSKFLVCNEDVDHAIGYVGSKDLLNRVLANQGLALNNDVQIHNTLIVPDMLTFSETLRGFETAGEDFAVIMNGYVPVVGIITPNDVTITPMGNPVGQGLEEQTVVHGENPWLIDGGTPVDDVIRVLGIDEFPQSGNHETIGGFMMFMLCKIPKRTDSMKFTSYKLEVMDIDNYRTDQLPVTRIDSKATALSSKLPDVKDKEESVT